MAKDAKRVRKATLLKAGQILCVRVRKRGVITMKVPEGTEIAIEGKSINNSR